MKDTFIPAFDVKFLIRLLLKHFIPAFILAHVKNLLEIAHIITVHSKLFCTII